MSGSGGRADRPSGSSCGSLLSLHLPRCWADALALAAPWARAQDVVGNERGGKISYQEGGMQAAMSAAQGHCTKFGKKAQVTQMNPTSDGFQLGFECN